MAGSNPVLDKMWLLNCTYPGTGRSTPIKDSLAKLRPSKSDKPTDEQDTGLGSVDDAGSDFDDSTPRIMGKAHVYSGVASESSEDEEQKGSYAEIDSDCAKQQDEQYKLIMKTKKEATIAKPYSSKPLKSKPPKSACRVSMATTTPSPTKKKKSRTVKPHLLASDHESVKTEDFENQFHTMMVKQVANVPIINFDQFIVDSDLDTVRSQVIREKFLSALNKSFGGDSEASSDNESAKIDALVEQKIQEILKRVKQNSGDFSDLDSIRAFQGSPSFHHIQEESEEEEVSPPVYSRSRSSKTKRISRRSPVQRKRPDYEDDMELGEEAHEIERQSAQIRKEIESEGWHSPGRLSPVSPHRSRTPTLPKSSRSPSLRTPQTSQPRLTQSFHNLPMHVELESDQSLKLRDHLSKMQLEVIRAKKEKQTVAHEAEQLGTQVKDHKQELKAAEKQIKEHRARAEDTRSELMLAEFKRDSARKELEHLQEEIKKKRSNFDFLGDTEETTDGNTSTDYSKFKDLKMSRIEVAKMMSEKADLQSKLQSRDTLERERQELDRQLASAKDSMLAEQKNYRQKEEQLKEDLDAADAQLHDTQTKCDELEQQMSKIQSKLKQTESEKSQIIQDKISEHEELRTQLQEQLAQNKQITSQEMEEIRKQLSEVTERLAQNMADLNAKEDQSMKLRDQVITLQTKLSDELERKSALKEDLEKKTKLYQQEKEREFNELRKQAEEDRNMALDELAGELERQNQMVLNQAEQRFMEELTDMQGQQTARDLELEVLREKLKQQDTLGKQLAEKIRNEANIRFRQLVQEERSKWDDEKEQEINRQLASMRDEVERTTRQLREELEAERQLVDSQLKQIMELKKETHRSMERLRDTIRRHEEEISRLKKENKDLHTKEQESQTSNDSQERTLLNDLNEECRKVAGILGTTARVVAFTNIWSPGKGGKSSMKAAVGTALTNLKASNEDFRNMAKDMKHDIDTQKQALRAVEKQKKESMDALKQKMQKEKLQSLETLKDRLIKEHLEEVDKLHKCLGKGKSMHKALREKDSELKEIQHNMKKWKSQTTEKLAVQFQEEVTHELDKRLKEYKKQQREWEREKATQQRELERLEKELTVRTTATNALNLSISNQKGHVFGSPIKASHPHSNSTLETEAVKTLKELQGKVKQLQVENMSLRRNKLSTSTPDLQMAMANASFSEGINNKLKKDDHAVRQLEIQLERAEHRIRLAEDRAEKNDSLLNQKLLEMSKLQSTLTQQTKELMQLERAYSQLQLKSVRPPSRMVLKR